MGFTHNHIEPIITRTLDKLLIGPEQLDKESVEAIETKRIFLQYRGKVSEKFEKSLISCKAPCKVIFTLRKLRAVLPALKAPIEMPLKSGVVYKISCPRCNSCYVGQTSRHLLNRIREHNRKSSPVGNHFVQCNVSLTMEYVSILATSLGSLGHLMTLEALWINSIKPEINTKDEYRSRALVIRLL